MAEIYQVQHGECAGDVPTMIRVIRICRNCGAKIFSDAPEGLCTGCVLEAAIGVSPDAVAGGATPAMGTIPRSKKQPARANCWASWEITNCWEGWVAGGQG